MADTLEMTAEEQRLLDQMRADDAQAPEPEPQPPQPPQPAPGEPAEPAQLSSPDQPAPQQRDDRVPHAALHEERLRRQRVEGERDSLQQQIRTLEERTNLLLQRFSQPAVPQQGQPQPAVEHPQAPPIPDLAADPVGHIIGRQLEFDRRLQEQSAATQQQQTAYQQQLQAQQVINAVVQHSQALESQYTAEHPDYPAAVMHLKREAHRELELRGFNNPVDRENIINQEGFGTAVRAIQAGANPAHRIYELAKLRGYQPPAPPPQPVNGDHTRETSSNGVSNGAGNGALNGPTPQQRLATLEQGQQQARSLGQARGSAPPPLTAQRLLELSDAEFDKMMQTPEGLALLGQGG